MKKSPYLTENTISMKSQQIFNAIQELGLIHSNQVFQPQNAALLVLDMQNYFLDPASHAFIPSAPAIIPNIQLLISSFIDFDRPVYFTKHSNPQETAGMMAVWWKELISPESHMGEIISEIDSFQGEVLYKERYDAFFGTSLDERLHHKSIKQLVICGVMTHLCCETTARSAFMQDYQVFFTVDGTATYTEQFHLSSVINLAHGFAKPVFCRDITGSF
jgi:isochorismate hydrolase